MAAIELPSELEKHYRLRETGLACFLVLAVHVSGSLAKCHYGFVEIHSVPRCDLVARDHVGCPCLDRTERASLDTRNLHVPGDRVTRHSEVMLESGFRRVFYHKRWRIVRGGDECSSHR